MASLNQDINFLFENYDIGERRLFGEGTPKQIWLSSPTIEKLERMSIDDEFPHGHRVLILAPHPDDEIVGCAGLIQQLIAKGIEIVLIAITNGTSSHPNSTLYQPYQLNQLRPLESLNALKFLGAQNIERIEFNILDGEVSHHFKTIVQKLEKVIRPNDILVSTFYLDGHPDHEFTAYAAYQIATQYQLKFYQVLIWALHWADPESSKIPWEYGLRLDLNKSQIELKEQAIRCFKTQIESDNTTNQPPILLEHAIQRVLIPFEIYIHEK